MKKYKVGKHIGPDVLGTVLIILILLIAYPNPLRMRVGMMIFSIIVILIMIGMNLFAYQKSGRTILLDENNLILNPEKIIRVSSIDSVRKTTFGPSNRWPTLNVIYENSKSESVNFFDDVDALIADLLVYNPKISVNGVSALPKSSEERECSTIKMYSTGQIHNLMPLIHGLLLVLLLILILDRIRSSFSDTRPSYSKGNDIPPILLFIIGTMIWSFFKKTPEKKILSDGEKLYFGKWFSIRIQDIDRVELTSSPLMKKDKPSLIIHYKFWNKAWFVDMKDREALVDELKAINPKIEVKNA